MRTGHTEEVRFDTVLTEADVSALRTEVAAFRLPRRRIACGVSVRRDGRERPWQFQAVVDERDQSWTFDRQGTRIVTAMRRVCFILLMARPK